MLLVVCCICSKPLKATVFLPTPCRWRIQVRKVLSADKVFQHTGLKQKSETVWRLDQVRSHKRQLLSGAGYGVVCQGLKQKSETV